MIISKKAGLGKERDEHAYTGSSIPLHLFITSLLGSNLVSTLLGSSFVSTLLGCKSLLMFSYGQTRN